MNIHHDLSRPQTLTLHFQHEQQIEDAIEGSNSESSLISARNLWLKAHQELHARPFETTGESEVAILGSLSVAAAVSIGPLLRPRSALTSLASAPPSIVSSSFVPPDIPTIDVVSIGSLSRLDHLTSQIETWASHKSVRNFWGFSELQDVDDACSSSRDARETCSAFHRDLYAANPSMTAFFSTQYGKTEGGRDRAADAGWVCAQRRPGRAFGWLNFRYGAEGEAESVPDYLVLVDDDTYVGMDEMVKVLEANSVQGEAAAVAGCVFEAAEG